jgi:hypothetical protein
VRLRLPALLVLPVVLCASAGALAEPPRPVAHNPANRMLRVPIDDYGHDGSKRCRKRASAGALALVRWLERHVRGESWGIVRCERGSLHAEGRAVDWHLDSAVPADRRAARALIALLLATDRSGNPHALARRMGVQELIWNCRSWWAGAERMGPYSVCFDKRGRSRKHVNRTVGHRDHVHIGLTRAGARKRTSFWRSRG